jgi:DNA primase
MHRQVAADRRRPDRPDRRADQPRERRRDDRPDGAAAVPDAPQGGQATAEPNSAAPQPDREVRRPDPRDRGSFAERETLKLALQQPGLVATGYEQVRAEAFTQPAYAAVHVAVQTAGGPPPDGSPATWVETVAAGLPEGPLRSLVSELAVEPPRQRADFVDERYAGAILARMAERVAAADEGSLRSQLQRAEAAGEHDRTRELAGDLAAVAAYRRALADRARGEA